MLKKIFTSLAFAAICMVSAAQTVDVMQVVENDPEVRVGTLDCGIKYYLRSNKKDPQRANFHIVYDVGAVQEEDNQNGLAHFLEHMAFNGSKNFQGNAMIDYLQSIGVRFGENLNAGTGQELTTYMVTNVPITRQGVVDTLLLVLHDWAGFINLDNKDIDEERGVIREEWRQGNNANRRVMEKQFGVLFNNSIYSKRNIIGSEEVLKSFTYDDLKSFYHKWYRPDMQAFVIVGDFDVDAMEAKLKATMADIKEFDVKTPKNKVIIPVNETPMIAIVADPELTSTSVEFAIRHQPLPEKFNSHVIAYKMDILTSLISSMANERLNEIKMKPNAPFLGAHGGYFSFIEPADLLDFSAQTKDGESLKALEALYTELLRIEKGGFSEAEFNRAKANMMSRFESTYKNRNDRTNSQFINMYMNNFTKNEGIPSADKLFELQKALVESTTLAEVNQTAKALVTDQNNVVMISMPAREELVAPTEADVLAVLEKVKASDIQINTATEVVRPLIATTLKGSPVAKTTTGDFGSTIWTLKNGVTVVLKKTDYKADEILFEGIQKGGKSKISDLSVLASSQYYSYYSSMAGVSDFDQVELSKVLAGKNARVGLSIYNFGQSLSGNCAPKDIETMLQLAYLKYTAPRFDTTAFGSLFNQIKAMLPNQMKNPDVIVQDSLSQVLYGNNPREPKLSMELLDMLTLKNLETIHKELFSSANGMVFTFVGNFDEAVLKPLVEKYLGSLPSSKASAKIGTHEIDPVKGNIDRTFQTKMETPKVTSFTVYTGKTTGTEAQNVAMNAIKYILDIRYTKSIREEAGGTYGVGIRATMNTIPEPTYRLMIMFNTDMSKIAQLQPIIYKEINDLIENGPAIEDLNKAKENFIKKFAEVNNTNSAWMNYVSTKAVWGEDKYTNYLKDVEALSVESVKKVAKELFSQGNICTVIQEPVQ